MRQPSRLVVSPPSSRYASLHAEELNRLGLPLGSRLWKVASTSLVDDAASVHELLTPLLRAVDFKGLLQSLDASDAIDDAPWTLRYENHGNGQADERAQTYLNAIARYLPGPPALLTGTSGGQNTRDYVLLRSRRLWYLTAADSTVQDDRERALDVWTRRPYTFSAATDLLLARAALSLALQAHHQNDHSSERTIVLDPCCGSGTNLFAAATRGLPSIGCDLNPIAVEGANANLKHAAKALEWPKDVHPTVVKHDVSDALSAIPHADLPKVGVVLGVLPFGRQQRLDHAHHIRDLLERLTQQLPTTTTYALLSATSIAPTLRECGLELLSEERTIGGERCVLSLSRHSDSLSGLPVPLVADEEAVVPAPPPLELLTGGGLRGAARPLEAGDMIEVQCRAAVGRAWLKAQIVHAASEEDSWRCKMFWHAAEEQADRKELPGELVLAKHGGPNWRFASRRLKVVSVRGDDGVVRTVVRPPYK